MKKLIISTIASMVLAGSLLGATTTEDKVDYRTDNKVNRCLQASEYSDGAWTKLTDRQLRSGKIYDMVEYTPYRMKFGGVTLSYIDTVENEGELGNYDRYRGQLDNGKIIEVSSVVKERKLIFVDIEGLHLKKFYCFPSK